MLQEREVYTLGLTTRRGVPRGANQNSYYQGIVPCGIKPIMPAYILQLTGLAEAWGLRVPATSGGGCGEPPLILPAPVCRP